MPSSSQKQHNLMAMVAHDPQAAKRTGVPQSVGKEFVAADKGRKFGTGTRPDQQGLNKPKTRHGKEALFARGGEVKESKAMEMRHAMAMKKAGVPKKMVKEELAEAKAMKKGGKAACYARGGGVESKGKTRGRMV